MTDETENGAPEIQRGGYRARKPAEQGDLPADMQEPRKRRRSRLSGQWDDFYVPETLKQPGFSYQWEAIKILGQEVDASEFVRIADGGWEPVRPTEMPDLMPSGYKGNTIDRKGQRLYKRPQYLTDEARQEDYQIARQQKDSKINQVYGTGSGEASRSVQTLDVKTGGPTTS